MLAPLASVVISKSVLTKEEEKHLALRFDFRLKCTHSIQVEFDVDHYYHYLTIVIIVKAPRTDSLAQARQHSHTNQECL